MRYVHLDVFWMSMCFVILFGAAWCVMPPKLQPCASEHTRNIVPGTMVLVHTKRPSFRVRMQQLLTSTFITHVGMVVLRGDKRYLLHSVSRGVMLVDFDSWLEKQKTKRNHIYIRTWATSHVDVAKLNSVTTMVVGRRYNHQMWKAIVSNYFPGMEMAPCLDKTLASKETRLFCSELLAHVCEQLGLMSFQHTALTPRLVLPYDFWCTLRLPLRVPLGPPYQVV